MFHLDEEADAGDLVGQKQIKIGITDDASTLYDKVVDAGEALLRTYYPKFESGYVPRKPQDHSSATWWPKRRPHHGLIDWNQTAKTIYNWIRGLTHPYPGAFSYIDDQKITFWAARPPDEERVFGRPGQILGRNGDVLNIATWEGSIPVTRVQIENEVEIPAGHLLERYDITTGDRFKNARDRLV